MSGRWRRILLFVGILSFVVATILASPFILIMINGHIGADWNRLSDVGQSYDFIAAIFSALALLGVALSLAGQTRQNKTAQADTFRGLHAEIVKLAVSEPDVYMPCYGANTAEEVHKTKQWLFCSLRANYWLAGFEIGEWDERNVRLEFAPEIYGNRVAMEWWNMASPIWNRMPESPKRVRLARILDEEVHKFRADHGDTPSRDVPATHLLARSESWIPNGSVGGKLDAETLVSRV
jgi:hypothetical protein